MYLQVHLETGVGVLQERAFGFEDEFVAIVASVFNIFIAS